MQVNVQTVAAKRTRMAADALIAAASAMPPDRVVWKPLDMGRTVLDQLIECSVANLKWVKILRHRAYVRLPGEVLAPFEEIATLDQAVAKLRETSEELRAAILSVPDAETSSEIEAPWGPYSLADCCLHAYWNMCYHEGQINYIQTLYGDTEEHY